MEPRRRFRFLKELAAGGFGKVYLAEMVTGDNFSSVVAIKLLHGKWLGNDEIVMRSRDEARLLGRLRHRSIVRVEDLTSINGQCAIVMEYLNGADLKTACAWLGEQARPFPRKSAFEIIASVADALDAAYNARPLQGGDPLRVIHRDIKPSNVMITVEGDVKVLDFGTARASFEDREAKTQALAFGSAAYMAPERHLGEDDTVSGDIFSLGVTAYEVLALDGYGKIQVRPERYEQQLAERLGKIDFSGLDPGVRADALDLLGRMLAYEMHHRPTAAEVREGMESLAESTRDMGLRRLAREAIITIADTTASPIDPADALAGAVVHEDTSGMSPTGGAETGSRLRTWDDPQGVLENPRPDARPRPEITSRPTPVPPAAPPGLATVRPAEGPRGPGARPPPPALPPEPSAANGLPAGISAGQRRPRPSSVQLTSAPTIVGIDADVAPVEPPRQADPAPEEEPPAPYDAPAEESAPPSSGLFLKLGVAAALIVAVLSIGGVVAVLYYRSTLPTAAANPPRPVTPDPAQTSTLPSGTEAMDYSANAAGRGGVILTVPAGASEVAVTNSTDYRTEWNGTRHLRLKDLAPGVYRTKVKPTGEGAALRADFTVEADKTCALSFRERDGMGSWEVGECR